MITKGSGSERDQARFWSKVALPNDRGCMLWMGPIQSNGYGKFSISYQRPYAHRFSYELAYGPIPHELVIDHLCRVRHCVAPLHLEAVTPRENVLRGETIVAAQLLKTHCPQGHPYDAANTYLYRGVERRCRACNRDGQNRKRAHLC